MTRVAGERFGIDIGADGPFMNSYNSRQRIGSELLGTVLDGKAAAEMGKFGARWTPMPQPNDYSSSIATAIGGLGSIGKALASRGSKQSFSIPDFSSYTPSFSTRTAFNLPSLSNSALSSASSFPSYSSGISSFNPSVNFAYNSLTPQLAGRR